jgi:hypothetical protein
MSEPLKSMLVVPNLLRDLIPRCREHAALGGLLGAPIILLG